MIETVKVKATDPEQGDYVLINADDFNEATHEIYDESDAADGMTVAQIKEALEAKGVEIPAGAKKADLLALLSAAGEGA